ncbi:hypothetical protein C942_04236 [Photobacterium marinum]|uniref:Uncharacterized protein n=1 Tax=Photobacterium marinum TaxID=1056511 RepID=L8JE36_9GAMM|nr:hypothetical protein C942_04236 [Photobacterium marinum]
MIDSQVYLKSVQTIKAFSVNQANLSKDSLLAVSELNPDGIF